MAKYRWRTRLRVVLPYWCMALFPKGTQDCGAHEWYRSDETRYHCYHCTAVTSRPPATP